MKNLQVEIINPSDFRSVLSYMPNPNEFLVDKVSFYKTIDDMLVDAKIGSHVRLRKDIVASFPFVFSQGKASDVVYETVRDTLFSRLSFEHDVREFLTAIEYGFSFSEVLWVFEDGLWVPDSLRNKYPSEIGFKTVFDKGRSKWLPVWLRENKVLTEDKKFLVYRNNPRAENPYGTSDLVMCYWAWRFKTLGFEFWAQAAKKAGVPSLAVLFDAPNDSLARESAEILTEQISRIEGGAGIALANVKGIQTLEMSGALRDHKTLIDTCNQEIAYALTTQSLSTQEGEFGTRAQATVHDENLVRVAHGDTRALQGVFQTLIDWFVEINFPNQKSPKGEFDLESYASFAEIMQAVQNRVPISKESLYTRYGLPRPKDDEDTFLLQESQSMMLSDMALADSKKKSSLQNMMFL